MPGVLCVRMGVVVGHYDGAAHSGTQAIMEGDARRNGDCRASQATRTDPLAVPTSGPGLGFLREGRLTVPRPPGAGYQAGGAV